MHGSISSADPFRPARRSTYPQGGRIPWLAWTAAPLLCGSRCMCCTRTCLYVSMKELPRAFARISRTTWRSQEYLNMNYNVWLILAPHYFQFFQNAVSITTCRSAVLGNDCVSPYHVVSVCAGTTTQTSSCKPCTPYAGAVFRWLLGSGSITFQISNKFSFPYMWKWCQTTNCQVMFLLPSFAEITYQQ